MASACRSQPVDTHSARNFRLLMSCLQCGGLVGSFLLLCSNFGRFAALAPSAGLGTVGSRGTGCHRSFPCFSANEQ